MNGETNKERKEKLKDFFGMLALPIGLSMISSVFYRMAMVAFTGEHQPSALSSEVGRMFSGFSLQLLVMWVLVAIWIRPALRYIDAPDEELRAVLRSRVKNIYRDAFLMIVVSQGLSMLPGLAAPGLTTRPMLAAALVAFLAQAAVVVVFVDSLLANQKSMMEFLYSPEELSRPRPGFVLPMYVKLSSMVAGFALLPFVLVYAAALRQVPWSVIFPHLSLMLIASSYVLMKGLSTVRRGIQEPINGLINKMRRVAGGDFVKTRVYFSDEVGGLKAGFNEMVDGLKERAELQDTFGKYLSIEIARELIHNKKVNLGGEDIEAAVMFCDIRNFTPLSESMSAAEVVAFLNEYFRYVTVPITSHHGVINKFIGDAVMAVFTPQLGSADYAADAVRAAVDMRRALAEFNAARGGEPVAFGVGVHCGRLVAGNVGTFSRLEYTFIGDTVNAASRLQGKTKDYGVDLLVSGEVTTKARGSLDGAVSFEPLGKAALKGRVGQLEVYKVV